MSAALVRVACAVGVAMVGVTACGGDESPDSSDVQPASAFTAIVEWQASELDPVIDDNGKVKRPVIYIASADGETIDVGVQADVAESTIDIATVRFTDESGDAFDDDLADRPVRDDGVMLLVGALPDAAPSVLVDVVRYLGVDRSEPLQLEIAHADGTHSSTGAVNATVSVVTPP